MVLRIKARAKLNLGLSILNRRQDGYHNLKTVMQTIDLHDRIILRSSGPGINIISGDPELPNGKRNLAYQAAELLIQRAGVKNKGVEIEIEKRIPYGAGMGGGSADAAAVLRGLALLWGLDLELTDLLSWARELGADVPFCLLGGTAFARGIGERMLPLNTPQDIWALIVKPELRIDTGQAFDWAEGYPRSSPLLLGSLLEAIELGDCERIGSDLYNDFAAPVYDSYPGLKLVKERLGSMAGGKVQISGSGSSLFTLTSSRAAACKLKDDFLTKEPEIPLEKIYIARFI